MVAIGCGTGLLAGLVPGTGKVDDKLRTFKILVFHKCGLVDERVQSFQEKSNHLQENNPTHLSINFLQWTEISNLINFQQNPKKNILQSTGFHPKTAELPSKKTFLQRSSQLNPLRGEI